MRIGIDLDDTFFDFMGAVGESRGFDPSKVDTWEGLVTHGKWWSREDMERWLRNSGIFKDLKPHEGAVRVVRDLYKRGHTIVFITARPDTDRVMEDTFDNLTAHLGRDLNFELHISHNKAEVEQCDVYIDDAVHHLEDLDSTFGRKVYLYVMDRPWNESIEADFVPDGRIRTWGQFYREVMELETAGSVDDIPIYPDETVPEPTTITIPNQKPCTCFEDARGIPRYDEEVRSVNEVTGGEKGTKTARYDLVPVGPLTEVARHYGRGAAKYEDRNWEKGYEWSKSYAAMMRHATQFWNGEDIDPETGSHHLAAVVFHAFAMMEWGGTHPELDDRPKHE